MQEFIAALISFFLVEPLQHEIADTLAATRAPREIVVAVTDCAREHGPETVDRATENPWWAASSALSIWTGLATPQTLLVEAAPDCAAAVEAIESFLNADEAASE
jgi:hypothetical protein